MKSALLFVIAVAIITGDVTAERKKGTKNNCIRLTPEKEAQIENVIERFTIFLNKLSQEMEDIDLKLIHLEIDEHSEDEGLEKETVLQLTVNNCVRKEYEPNEPEDLADKPAASNDTAVTAPSNTTVEDTTCEHEGETTTVEPKEITQEINDSEDINENNKQDTIKPNEQATDDEEKENTQPDRISAEEYGESEVKTESGSLNEYNKGPETDRIETIDVVETKSNSDKENPAEPSVYLFSLSPKGRAFVDELRKVKKKTTPIIIFVEDLNPTSEKRSKYVFNQSSDTEYYIESDNSEGVIENRSKSGKAVPEVLDLKLPRNGEILLEQFSQQNGYPIVIYIEDLPDLHRRRYVFIDK